MTNSGYLLLLLQQQLMGGRNTKESQYKRDDPIFFKKQMINSHKTFSIEDQYELFEKIGDGTYAEVFRGKSKRSQKLCAIKRVDKSKAKGISSLLENQFNILRELDHPNIIKVYGMYEDKKDYYIVSELIKGKELYDYFKDKKKLTEKEAFHIFYQVFLAINHLHKNNIMHRDIKLENIIYDPQSKILKLLDFGSAYQYESKAMMNYKCVGTVSYIAPEVISKVYNYKCDHWSLGVFLYLLLSGSTPFAGKDQEDTFYKIKHEPLTFTNPAWETVSADVKKLIQSLMEKSPEKRIELDTVTKNIWFNSQRHTISFSQEDQYLMINILKRLTSFGKLKMAEIQLGVLVYMVNFVVTIEEELMIKCFHLIDTLGDGVITTDELVQSFIEYADRPRKIAEATAKEIMQKIDFNHSDDISYSQYLVAGTDLEALLSDQNLEKTFFIIDGDGSGSLSASQLQAKLGEQFNESYYSKLIAFFDEDKDGQISLKQFKRMMRNILQK